MAENTRMKELLSDVKNLSELMESHDKQYASRFEMIDQLWINF